MKGAFNISFGPVRLSPAALDLLMPLACVIGTTGHVVHVGPTLARVVGGEGRGQRFLELFELRRPRGIETLRDLVALTPCRLRLRLRKTDVSLHGQAISLEDGSLLVTLALSVAGLTALDRFGLGAHDFPPTDSLADLLYLTEAKNAAMAEAERLTATLLRENAAALKQAVTDPLTGLLNRRGLEQGLENLTIDGAGFALMHIDLDHFKAINDTFGHAEGDRMLLNVAEALRLELRGSDLMARMGGDEFVVALRGLTDRRVLARIAGRIIQRIEASGKTADPNITLSASIGISLTDNPANKKLEALHHEADLALYAAKARGRHQATFYTEAPSSPFRSVPSVSDRAARAQSR